MEIRLKAPAKVNLFLEVLGRRPDGYHEVAAVLQEIGLEDDLSAEPAGSFTLSCSGLAIPEGGGENLVLKAARLLAREAGVKEGVAFRLHKRIPAGAGLGGGSSDAAAALKACCRLWKLDLSAALGTAAAVGSDVPFFLTGGTALCTGRGERIERLPSPLSNTEICTEICVVWPGIHLSTQQVYGAMGGDFSGRKSASEFVKSLQSKEMHLFNRLEEPALKLRPELGLLRKALGPGALMSGSGSAFFRLGGLEKTEIDSPNIKQWQVVRTKIISST